MTVDMQMQHMVAVGQWRLRTLEKTRGRRGAFWRMCQCGQEFYAIGRQRKVSRRLAQEHIERCRAKAMRRAQAGHHG